MTEEDGTAGMKGYRLEIGQIGNSHWNNNKKNTGTIQFHNNHFKGSQILVRMVFPVIGVVIARDNGMDFLLKNLSTKYSEYPANASP